MIIDRNCFIAIKPSECEEKRLLWYSSQGSIITHPHFSHWAQALVLGWWIVESWRLWLLWPSLSNSWSTYKIHATASQSRAHSCGTKSHCGDLMDHEESECCDQDVTLSIVQVSRQMEVIKDTCSSRSEVVWSSNNVWQCGRLLVCESWMGTFLLLHSPSSPVTVRARPVPPCYLVTIIRYNFTTP